VQPRHTLHGHRLQPGCPHLLQRLLMNCAPVSLRRETCRMGVSNRGTWVWGGGGGGGYRPDRCS